MKKKIIFIAVLLLVTGALTFLFMMPLSTTFYHGQEAFQTESEYAQFKQTLLDVEADFSVYNVEVLSSEPPIIVEFMSIGVSKEYKFPYGEEQYGILWHTGVFLVVGLVGLIVLYFVFASKEDNGLWFFDGWRKP